MFSTAVSSHVVDMMGRNVQGAPLLCLYIVILLVYLNCHCLKMEDDMFSSCVFFLCCLLFCNRRNCLKSVVWLLFSPELVFTFDFSVSRFSRLRSPGKLLLPSRCEDRRFSHHPHLCLGWKFCTFPRTEDFFFFKKKPYVYHETSGLKNFVMSRSVQTVLEQFCSHWFFKEVELSGASRLEPE